MSKYKKKAKSWKINNLYTNLNNFKLCSAHSEENGKFIATEI